MTALRATIGLAAAVLLALALAAMAGESRGLSVRTVAIGSTPATVFVPAEASAPAPAVVIAHGFAGSEQLMHPFATTLARAGYVAVTYDLLGHGTNPAPLTGDVASEDGATANLLDEMARVADFARSLPESDGRLAVLGHSMSSDLVVRFARAERAVAATVAISLFSREVTPSEPRNLLVVTGAWEPGLTDEALRVAGLAAGGPAEPFVTYGDHADGTARRAVLAPMVEHVGVLYAPTSLRETWDWLDASFGVGRAGDPPRHDGRGPWILALAAAVLLLGWAAAPLLPRVADPVEPRPPVSTRPSHEPADAAAPVAPADPVPGPPPVGRRAFALAALGPAVLAPLLAGLLPAPPLGVPVADYLALHFALYGLLTGLAVWRFALWPRRPRPGPALLAALSLVAFAVLALYLPLDAFVASFLPGPHRWALLVVLALGLLPYFLGDEVLTRHPSAPRFAYPIAKLAFLLSLALAIALDPQRLFFLLIILPVILLFFLIFGLLSRWTHRATASPLPAAAALTILFAWAIAVTFPVLG